MSVKAQWIGNTIICYLNGKLYNKVIESDAEKQTIMKKLLNVDENSEEEIQELITIMEREKSDAEVSEEREARKEEKRVNGANNVLAWMEDIKENGDPHFEVDGIKLYMKGINITVPEFLAIEFWDRRENEEDLTSLMNFWKLLSLNKDPRCREDLYKFLINHDMVVTPSGYFLAYRNVDTKKKGFEINPKQKALNDFINKAFIKTKAQKKNIKNYDIYRLRDDAEDQNKEPFVRQGTGWFDRKTADGDYDLVGNLKALYEGLPDEEEPAITKTVYTDNWTKTMTIIIGERVFMDREKCDADHNETCSAGLHLGSPSFVRKGGFGQEGLVCLCNPMHVVSVPYKDGEKLRCCEYLPIGVAEYDDNGRIIPVETATFEYDYAEFTQKEIDDMLNEERFESLVEHEIIPRELSKASLRTIQNDLRVSLNDMKEVVNSRVTKAM
jgi:hypothetical protein